MCLPTTPPHGIVARSELEGQLALGRPFQEHVLLGWPPARIHDAHGVLAAREWSRADHGAQGPFDSVDEVLTAVSVSDPSQSNEAWGVELAVGLDHENGGRLEKQRCPGPFSWSDLCACAQPRGQVPSTWAAKRDVQVAGRESSDEGLSCGVNASILTR